MAYDKSLDQVLKVFKVKSEQASEGFTIEVRSYRGGEARICLTRYYRLKQDTKEYKAGKWMRDKTKYPRISFRLFRWLRENAGGLDAAYEEWERSAKQNPTRPKDEDGDEF